MSLSRKELVQFRDTRSLVNISNITNDTSIVQINCQIIYPEAELVITI